MHRRFVSALCVVTVIGCSSGVPAPGARPCPACPAAPACPSPEPAPPEQADEAPRQLPVDLPRASEFVDGTMHLVVSITADGTCFFADRPLASCAEVRSHAERARQNDPTVRAVIQADRSASHGSVIEVLDQLKQAGISAISFAVAPLR